MKTQLNLVIESFHKAPKKCNKFFSSRYQFYSPYKFLIRRFTAFWVLKYTRVHSVYWAIPDIVPTPYVEELWHPGWSGENKIQGGSEKKAKNPGWIRKEDQKSSEGSWNRQKIQDGSGQKMIKIQGGFMK